MVSNMNQSSSAKEMHILNQWIGGLEEEEKFNCLNDLKDFKIIVSKSKRNIYTSFDAFSSDIDLLVRYTENGNSVQQKVAAKSLQDEWRKEFREIRVCIDCYYSWLTSDNNEDYFTTVCAKPHLLIYLQESKKDGSRWWPAKLLSLNDNCTVNIECFGDHLRSDDYKFEQCFLYADTEKELLKKAELAVKSKKKLHKKEFENAFKEVAKYIENVKQKYRNSSKPPFVPAPRKGQTITDANQHLKEMFPAAYAPEDSMEPGDNDLGEALDNDQYDTDSNDGSFVATDTHSSQGYGSHSAYHSDDSGDSNDTVEAGRQQREFRIVQIKSEYRQHNAQSDIQSQADSTAGLNTRQMQTQKRKANGSRGVKDTAAKRVASGRAEKANNEIITIDDEHDTERPSTSTSSQNHVQRSSAKTNGNYKVLLNEFAEISGQIAIHDQKKDELKAQQAIIMAKLEAYKK